MISHARHDEQDRQENGHHLVDPVHRVRPRPAAGRGIEDCATRCTLSPGHGKTVVGAYLVGARGTAKHALFLGVTVTATHTIGVYALGFVTLYLSQYILPERLYPILQVTSGLLVVGIGALHTAVLVGIDLPR